MTMEELIGLTSVFFRQFEQSLRKDLLFRKELFMKPKCLACGGELTKKNRDKRWDNFCVSCVDNCTALELLNLENEAKRLDRTPELP